MEHKKKRKKTKKTRKAKQARIIKITVVIIIILLLLGFMSCALINVLEDNNSDIEETSFVPIYSDHNEPEHSGVVGDPEHENDNDIENKNSTNYHSEEKIEEEPAEGKNKVIVDSSSSKSGQDTGNTKGGNQGISETVIDNIIVAQNSSPQSSRPDSGAGNEKSVANADNSGSTAGGNNNKPANGNGVGNNSTLSNGNTAGNSSTPANGNTAGNNSTSVNGNGAGNNSTSTNGRSTGNQSGSKPESDSSAKDETADSSNEDLKVEEIIVSNNLDFKTVDYFNLYEKGKKIEAIDVSQGIPSNLADYYIEIKGNNLPVLYTNVKEFKRVGDSLYVIPDADNFVQYSYAASTGGLEKAEGLKLEIPFVENGTSSGLKSAKDLFEKMKADPTKEYELTENLDASSLSGDFAIPGNFKGTLKGNGYTIYNLQVPLFENIAGGRVENLRINNASVSNQNGILANRITSGGSVEGVSIEASSINSPNLSLVGGLVGTLDNGKIANSNFVDSTVNANNTLGGIAGQINANGTVENCLVEAELTGTLYHGTWGTRVGGITGWHSGTIDKCYIDVKIGAKSTKGSGGLIGGPNVAKGSMSNSFCQVDGTAYQVAGFEGALGNASNIYVSSSSTATANVSDKLKSAAATKELIVDTLGMNNRIWNYVDASLSPLTQSNLIKYVADYNKANDIRYANVMKLAPFLNIEDVVKCGNALTHGNLTAKTIKTIVPYDSEKNLVMYLDSNGKDSVSNITVIYDDNTFDSFNVSFENLSGGIVAASNITELGIPYHFNKYVVGDISELKKHIVATASSWDYNTNIASTTQEAEARQYADNYTIFVKDNLDAFAEKLISTEYSYYGENPYIKEKIKGDLDSRLAEILYTYNYFNKWYNFEVGKINVTDLIFFDSELLSPDLTMDYIISSLYSGNRGTNQAYNHYNAAIKTKTGLELYSQLELLMDIAGYTDYNQWFDDNFSGILKEQNVIGYTPKTELKYRIWDNMKKLTGTDAHLLHILTIPEEEQRDLVLLSAPSQLFISSVNVYHKEANDTTRSQVASAFENYGIRLGKYYGTSLAFVEDGESNLNRDIFLCYETILAFQSSKYPGRQLQGAEEPMVKWIFEPQGRLYSGNAGAVANGKYTYYGYQNILTNFGLFSHENAHNQDWKYFYNNVGRRNGSGGEHHCEGILTIPEFVDGSIAFNLTREYKFTDYVVTNLSPERINSKEEIQDFYKDVFDSWYVFNSMYANAFIESPSAIKANVSKKVNEYRLKDGNITDTSSATQYGYGYVEYEFNNLNIQTFEQLYDAKVAVRPIYNVESGYYIEDFWGINWYEPSNPYGIADPGSFKRMGQELLGYAGYDKGFVTWLTQRSENDDDAIQKITGYSNMREYKLARYNEALSKLPDVPYFDHKQIEEVIKSAYATETRSSTANTLAIKKILYSAVKRVTSDFTDGTIYEPSSTMFKVSTAQELMDVVNSNCSTKGVHITLTGNIDFSGVSSSGSAYCDTFTGFLDGGSYTISGLSKPLFNEIRFGVVSNVVFEGETKTFLANRGAYSLVHHSNKNDEAVFIKQTVNNTFNAEYNINVKMVTTFSRSYSLERSIEGNSVSESSVSEGSVLQNSVSESNIEENGVSGNSGSESNIEENDVSQNSVSGKDAAATEKENGGGAPENQNVEATVEEANVMKEEDSIPPESLAVESNAISTESDLESDQ